MYKYVCKEKLKYIQYSYVLPFYNNTTVSQCLCWFLYFLFSSSTYRQRALSVKHREIHSINSENISVDISLVKNFNDKLGKMKINLPELWTPLWLTLEQL